METVSVRELRNNGGAVLDRVAQGTSLIVTRDGAQVAELRPVRRPTLSATQVVARWRTLPAVDPDELRADIDAIIDQSL